METLGQAEKAYFKPGRLTERDKQIILHITNGDAYTKLISDFYFVEAQQNMKVGKWAVSSFDNSDYEIDHDAEEPAEDGSLQIEKLREIKQLYLQLKSYNKNVFPIKNLNINGGGTKDQTWEIIRSLKQRSRILENIKKLPSVAIRNMKEDIRQERDSAELQEYNRLLEYFLMNYASLNNRDEKLKKVIERKMFRANITLKDLLNFADEKRNLLGGFKFTKNAIKKIVSEHDYSLEIIYEKGNIMVIDVTDAEGIKAIGCNSLWCFTYGNGYNDFNKYSTNGHVYAIINFNEPSDSEDFMYVLIKPLVYDSVPTDDNGDEENHNKLYTMSNDMIDSPLPRIDHLVGLKNAPGIFHFDISYEGPTSKWPYEDPNQLKLDLKETRHFINKLLKENIISPNIIQLNNETFYHQTSPAQAQSILENGFNVYMHDGQARFTHGVYFLNHSEAHYGEKTLSVNINGNFIDFTNDELGHDWIDFRNSFDWNNYVDLTEKIQKAFPQADGLVFSNKYMLVVWYPEKCISNVQLIN